MKIYDIEGFPNPARVRIALAEKGASDKVEFIPVDVMGGEHRTSEFKAKNPDATVPYMELDCGTNISQCNAITEYIDHSYGEAATLTGQTAKERALISMMNARVETGLLNAVGDYFHHATDGLGPELETDQLPAWGERQKKRAQSTMRYLNDVLADQDYVAGDAFSMADITAYTGLGFSEFAKVEIASDLSHLKAWREKISARPSCAV